MKTTSSLASPSTSPALSNASAPLGRRLLAQVPQPREAEPTPVLPAIHCPADFLEDPDVFDVIDSFPAKAVDMIIAPLPDVGVIRCLQADFLETMWQRFDRVAKPSGTIIVAGDQCHRARVMRYARHRRAYYADRSAADVNEYDFVSLLLHLLARPEDTVVVPFDSYSWGHESSVMKRPGFTVF